MSWIGGIIVVFIIAAYLNPDTAPWMGAATLLLMFIFAVSGVISMTKSFNALREKRREEKAAEEKRQAFLAEKAAIEAELHPRLNSAFTPIVEHQQNLNKQLLDWLKREYDSSDKPEYKKHLEKYIGSFEANPQSECNSEFLKITNETGIQVLTLGSYVIAPFEFLDKADWEKHILFKLIEIEHQGKGEFYEKFLCSLNLDQANEFMKVKLADSLKLNHLENAVLPLRLPDTPVEEFVKSAKSEESA